MTPRPGAVAAAAAALVAACSGGRPAPPASPARAAPGLPPLLTADALPPAPAGIPDGDDDGAGPPGPGLAALATAPAVTFERVDPPAGAHPLVCDLAEIAGQVAATTSVAPLDLDGAKVALWDPAAGAWHTVLDWDRGGAARITHEVGGQGIARLSVIDGRLWATDSDAPEYGGFGLSSAPFEDYVFVSERDGRFAPLAPGDRPPAGTRVVPFAFHTLDVIEYDGAVVVSGGSVDLAGAGRRTGTRYPGALFTGAVDDTELAPFCFPGAGHPVGVVRTTSLIRYRGRLWAGLQNNERRVAWDLAVVSGDPRAADAPRPVLARVTSEGGWLTRRFATGGGWLYWVAGRPRGGPGALFVSRDGVGFERVALPDGAGQPHDLTVAGDTRWLLTSTGLWRSGPEHRFEQVAPAPPGDPFGRVDPFCSAPLQLALGELWAGSTRDGALYRVVAAPTQRKPTMSSPRRGGLE